MTLSEYLGLDAAGASTLHKLATLSPWHAKHSSYESEAADKGSLLHALALEPDTVGDRFYRFDGEKRTDAKKAEWASAEADGLIVVRSAAWETIEQEAEHVRRLLTSAGGIAWAEQTFTWDIDGIPCKTRPDALMNDGTLIDIKRVGRSGKGAPSAFRWKIERDGYLWQASWQTRAVADATKYAWLVQEEGAPPYLYRMPLEALRAVDDDMVAALKVWAACRECGVWPGYKETKWTDPLTAAIPEDDDDDVE